MDTVYDQIAQRFSHVKFKNAIKSENFEYSNVVGDSPTPQFVTR